jgi:hypothetical protein
LLATGPSRSPGSLETNVTASAVTALLWASVTVAVAVLVALPFAMIEAGVTCTATFAAGPAIWVKTTLLLRSAVLLVAVIVTRPAVVELVTVALYWPLEAVIPGADGVNLTPGSLAVNATGAPATGLECESDTVAVIVVVDVALATIVEGREKAMLRPPADPDVCVSVAWPALAGAEVSVAVIVDDPAVVELRIVTVNVPFDAVVPLGDVVNT